MPSNPVQLTRQPDGIARLVLNAGRGNPLSADVIEAMISGLDELHATPPKALVLTADGASTFSGGFALPLIVPYDRDQLSAFLWRYMEMIEKIIRLPSPTVAAVTGHAVAAGFILALATDFRVVSAGQVKLGAPEVNLGVPLPAGAMELFATRTSAQHALRLSVTGELFGADEAWRIGFADMLSEKPERAAMEFASRLAAAPGTGVVTGRTLRGVPLAETFRETEERGHEDFLDCWFSPEAQAVLNAQAARLSRSR